MESEILDRADAQQPRWMVVDDNAGILEVFANFLKMISDADVSCFHSGEAALRAIEAEPDRFSVIITDLEMPGMSGIDLRMRVGRVAPQSKVLITTGNHSALDEESARLLGFRGLIYKPFSVAALKNTLEDAGAFEPSAASEVQSVCARQV